MLQSNFVCLRAIFVVFQTLQSLIIFMKFDRKSLVILLSTISKISLISFTKRPQRVETSASSGEDLIRFNTERLQLSVNVVFGV